MPCLGAVTGHEGRRGDGRADGPGINQLTAGLQARAKKGVRRAAEAQSTRGCHVHQGFTILAPDRQRLLVIDVLATGERGLRDGEVRGGRCQVDDYLNLWIGEQLFRRIHPWHTELRRALFCPLASRDPRRQQSRPHQGVWQPANKYH